MIESGEELVRRLQLAEVERIRAEAPSSDQASSQHHELPEASPDSPIAEEWSLFRCEVGRLLREGWQGRFALVKAGQPITVWDTLRDAAQAGQLLHGPGQGLVQPIQTSLPVLRVGRNRPRRD
jgi:hypothetical protein